MRLRSLLSQAHGSFQMCIQQLNCVFFQELYVLHSPTRSQHLQHNVESGLLSSQCEQFLGRLLLDHPSNGCALLHFLLSANTPHKSARDDQLLQCHLTSLTLMFHQLKMSKTENRQLDADLQKFYCLLAGFHPSSRQLAGGIPVKEFLQEIIEILHHDPSFLHWDQVYSALLGRNGSHLVELFNRVHCQYTFHFYQSAECRKVGVFLDDKLTDFQKCIVGLSRNRARSEAWRDVYTVCWMENRHFVDSILVRLNGLHIMCFHLFKLFYSYSYSYSTLLLYLLCSLKVFISVTFSYS